MRARTGFHLLDHRHGGWEHIPIIIGTELLARDAERGTRDTAGKQVYAAELLAGESANVLLISIPVRAILSQRCAIVRLIFHERFMVEPCHFQAESLATTTSAEFYC